jgi:CO/xanthine dehydrogenase Mo-binding subunit
MSEEFSFVGKPTAKLDAPSKVTGQAVYGHDMRPPRMLYGSILRSEYPHARILNIDTSRAKALPGVKAVLTAETIPEIKIG